MMKAVLVAAGVIAAVLLLVSVLQGRLIYLPYGTVASLGSEGEEVKFETSDGVTLAGWFFAARLAEPGPAVLVANGNAGNRSHRAPLAEALRGMRASVLLFDYRGFGDNPGTPTEEGLRRDALAARDYLAGRPEVDPARIVYFGESIGAAVVTRLALERTPAGLVLRSPFASLADVGRMHYPWLPVRLLLRDRYEVAAAIASVDAPLLVIAGERDRIVPIGQSRAVFEAAGQPKRFVEIEGADHNDLELFTGEELLSEVAKFLGEVAPRPRSS